MNTKPSNPKDIVGSGKPPMSTVPAGVLVEIGIAMLEGALKYGRHNYRAVGVRASIYYDAAMGHLMSWWEGEDIDRESRLSHVTKAITSLVVLRDSMLMGNFEDDRPPVVPNSPSRSDAQLAAHCHNLAIQYSHLQPIHYTAKNVKSLLPNHTES